MVQLRGKLPLVLNQYLLQERQAKEIPEFREVLVMLDQLGATAMLAIQGLTVTQGLAAVEVVEVVEVMLDQPVTLVILETLVTVVVVVVVAADLLLLILQRLVLQLLLM